MTLKTTMILNATSEFRCHNIIIYCIQCCQSIKIKEKINLVITKPIEKWALLALICSSIAKTKRKKRLTCIKVCMWAAQSDSEEKQKENSN